VENVAKVVNVTSSMVFQVHF